MTKANQETEAEREEREFIARTEADPNDANRAEAYAARKAAKAAAEAGDTEPELGGEA